MQGKYSVSPNDAVALSWAGLGNSELFKNAQTFQMPDGTTISKDNMGHLSGDYFGGLDKPNKGTPLCQ
ncbi:hypothetical protein [Olivibacter domesticus]|uniref:hypothetical protein n=1 Tax=Olivibacter domesticus TaxID=407022 RepID=UPI001113792A|nr:hypothetical protein [Olivibacter domesticus]